MSIPNASRSNGTSATTVELLPWQLAEIRRQLYIDLMGVAEHVAEEANRASQMSKNDGAQRVLGEDLRVFVHRTFADAVELLARPHRLGRERRHRSADRPRPGHRHLEGIGGLMAGAKLETTRWPGIYTRGDRYVAVYRDAEGVQRKETAATREEAQRIKRERETDRDRGELAPRTAETLHDYAREWVARYQGGPRGFREETRREYRATLDGYALRYFDERLRVVDLTARHVAQFVGWLTTPEEQNGRRLADKTVRNIVGVLRSCLATARREGVIRHNPADGAQLPHRPVVEDDEHHEVRALPRPARDAARAHPSPTPAAVPDARRDRAARVGR